MLSTFLRVKKLTAGLGLGLGLAGSLYGNCSDATTIQSVEAATGKAQSAYLKVGHLPKKDEPNMQYVPGYARPLYNNLNPAQLSQAQRQGLSDVQHILKATPLIPKATGTIMSQNWAQSLGKRGMGIADASLAANRAKVLKFLGFKPQDADKLYYFVSFSMPKSMLRSYAQQAMWDGGILVFKGPLPHVGLAQFITKDLNGLIGGKGAAATITIDPRMYDVYHITMAPTIVYSTVQENRICKKVHLKPFTYHKKKWTYPVCDQVNQKKYWKIEGAVTSAWALRQFKKAGAPGVEIYIKALAKAGLGKADSTKIQQPFKGQWGQAASPAQLQAIVKTVNSFGQQAYETPYGLAVGPAQTVKPGHGVSVISLKNLEKGPQPNLGADGEHTIVKNGVAYKAP